MDDKKLIFNIQNLDNTYSKKVIANNMIDALNKYKHYLENRISADYSYENVFNSIKSCTFEGFYDGDEYIF